MYAAPSRLDSLRDNPDVPPDEEGMICGGDMEVFIEVWN